MNSGLLGLLEGKYSAALNMLFTFAGAFLDPLTGKEGEYATTQIHTMFSELERLLRRKGCKGIVGGEFLEIVRVMVQKFKALVRETFDHH